MTEEGLSNLIGAMFRLVAQDIRYGNFESKKSAIEFLESDWYKEICDMLGVDYKNMKRLILNNKIAWRNKYE